MSRILVVDDAVEARHLLRMILNHAGHEVTEAADGAKALQAIQDGSFDLVISDGLMPVMDGFRLCIELRRNPDTSALPFILYTATFTDPDDAQLASTMGADAYLLKPSAPADILRTVHDLLDRSDLTPHGVLQNDRLVEVFESYSARMEQKFDQKVSDLSAMRTLRDSYRALLDNLPVHILTLDLEGRPDFANAMAREFSNVDDTANLLDAIHPDDQKAMSLFIESLQSNPRPMQTSTTVQRHDGAYCVFEVTARPFASPGGMPLGFVLASEDITRSEQQRELLLHAAEHDPLTGLPTRHVFDQRFDKILRNIGKGAHCALLFIDSDDLRGVNNQYGFDAGDATIANLARTIAESVRPGDLVARLCATEFVVLAEGFGWEEADELSRTIQSAVGQTSMVPAAPEMRISVNVSINVVPDAQSPGIDPHRATRTGEPAVVNTALMEALQGQPEATFCPVYSLEDRRLIRCSTRYAYVVGERLISGDELALDAAKLGVARHIATRIVELVLEQIRASGISCSIPLTIANVLDPMTFERSELAAARLAVDPALLLFEIPDRDAGGIRPPVSWLAAARHSAIGLIHICSDLSSPRIDLAGGPGADEIMVPVTEVLDGTGQIRPSALSVIKAWRESGIVVTVSDVADLSALKQLRMLGVTQASGDALCPTAQRVDQIPLTLPGKE